jgi:hypothetical protein
MKTSTKGEFEGAVKKVTEKVKLAPNFGKTRPLDEQICNQLPNRRGWLCN